MGMAIVRDDTKTITRREVEERIKSVGDYVKMDFLSSCLKKQIDFDTKKFVLLKLAEIYEVRKMFAESARMMRNAAEINTTSDGKMSDFMKSCVLFVRAGNLDEADVSFNKANAYASELQKGMIRAERKAAYKAKAEEYYSKDKRSHAIAAYERVLEMELPPNEKKEIQNILLVLYEKLGKIKEYYELKANLI